jgi:putative membrane protein
MGLANLVPGISGGTMLLAAGIYPRFIEGIAEVTTLKFRAQSLVVLGGVACTAALAIVLFAGTVKGLVVDHRWIMYSLFIGLTLGGVPLVKRLIGPMTPSAWGGAVVGLVGMALLAVAQSQGVASAGGGEASAPMFFFAGVAGASAMILPGVSGGYLLLVMDMYVPILGGIDAFKEGLKAADVAATMAPALRVVLPVGLGVVVGIVGVSNVLKLLLTRFEKPTLGVLLGLLLGAVVGLWPFQQGVQPALGDIVKGRVVTEEVMADLDADDWPTQVFTPSGAQVAGSIALVLLGLGITVGIARFGAEK